MRRAAEDLKVDLRFPKTPIETIGYRGKTAMKYSAGQAAKAVGVAKSTITKAISSGKISASKDVHGAWEIDPAELHRVYAPKPSKSVATEQSSPPMENSREIEHLTKLLSVAERQIEDIKEDRNEWRKQANTLLIENQKTKKKGLFGLW